MVNWCCRYYNYQESGFYYLQTRYYDPEICRFINADTFATTDIDGLLSTNMFSYCENNPVNNSDPTGESLLGAVLVGAAFGLVAQYVGDVIGNARAGKSGSDLFKPTSSLTDYIAAGVSGAIAAIPGGGIVGTMVAGATGNIAGDIIRGNISSVGDIGRSALKGAAANGIGYGAGKLAAKIKVNKINKMSRTERKIYLRDIFYKNSQKHANENLRNFSINTMQQVENRFWGFRVGVYSTITSTSIGRCFK